MNALEGGTQQGRHRRPGRQLASKSSTDTVMLHGVRDLPDGDNASGLLVEIDSSPIYELLLSLMEFGYARNGFSVSTRSPLMMEVERRIRPEAVQAFAALDPRCWFWHSLLFMAWDMRRRKEAFSCAQFIERIRSERADRLFQMILGCRGRAGAGRACVDLAVQGQHAARLKIGKVIFPDDPNEDHALERFLGLPVQATKEWLVRILDAWYEGGFREGERDLASRLAIEARTKRVIGRSAPTQLLRASAIGIHYLPPKAVKRVLLIPSIVCWPSIITIRFATTRMFFYPLPDETAEEDRLASQLVKIHSALADRERLRLLQILSRCERTVESLSRELAKPADSVRAQLITLRDAGIVMLRMNERRMSFEIRPNLPSVVFHSLQALLPDSTSRLSAV